MSRLRLPIAFIVWVAFAVLLAFAAFSTGAAHQADAAVKEGTNADGTVTIQQHAWGNYHWARTANPFSIKIGDNVSSAWDSYLQTAAGANASRQPVSDGHNDWDKAEETYADFNDMLNPTIVDGANLSNPKRCTPQNGRVEVCSAKYGGTGWLGVAQISIDSAGHILRGTAKMNDTYYSMAKYNTPFWRSHVMCQEIGHTFGLGHQDESGADLHTCMDYASNPDADNNYPNQHDYEQLRAIYDPTFTSTPTATARGHLDTTTTSQLTTAAKNHPNSRAGWGKLEHKTADGRHEVYVREFSNGEKLITFVELADQEEQPQQKK